MVTVDVWLVIHPMRPVSERNLYTISGDSFATERGISSANTSSRSSRPCCLKRTPSMSIRPAAGRRKPCRQLISMSCRIFPQPLKKPLHFHKTRRGTR